MNYKSHSVLSSLGLILTAAIWGFAFVIVKDSLDYVGAVWMIAFRFTIAAVILAAIFYKKFALFNRSYLVHGAVLGLFLFLAYLFQTIGCKFTTAGKNAFLTTVYVILIPLIGWPMRKKRPSWYVFVAAVMSVTGIGLLALQNDGGNVFDINMGDTLTLVCGIFYALHILFVEKYDETEDPVFLTVLQFAFAALFGWIVSPFMTDSKLNGSFPLEYLSNPRVILSMMYLGVFSTMVAFFLQNVCLKFVPSALASLFLSLESVFGVLFSTLLLGEHLSLRMWAGCVLIFGALMMAEVIPNIKRHKSDSAIA